MFEDHHNHLVIFYISLLLLRTNMQDFFLTPLFAFFSHYDSTLPGFVPFFRNKFPGLFKDSDWFLKGSKIHINPYTPKISMLILLTAFHTLHICSVEFKRFLKLSRTGGLFQGLSTPGKYHNKIQGLSRFSRTCTHPALRREDVTWY